MFYTILFWALAVLTLGTYAWLVWDIAHWLPKDIIGEEE